MDRNTVNKSRGEKIMEEKKQDKVRTELKELAKNVDDSYLRIAELLTKVDANALWSTWGYPDFDAYLEKEVGFKYRKARYLINIWVKFIEELGQEPKNLSGVPYSKLNILYPVVNKSNVKKWLTKAEVTGHTALKAEVKKELGVIKEEVTQWSVYLYPEQKETVEKAVERAMDIAKTESRGHAIELMAIEFLSGHTKNKDKKALQKVMNGIERAFGIKLAAFDNAEIMKEWFKRAKE